MAPTTTGEEHRQVQMSLRLPLEMAKALERLAEKEDRTVSAELRRLIRRHVLEAREGIA